MELAFGREGDEVLIGHAESAVEALAWNARTMCLASYLDFRSCNVLMARRQSV